MDNKGGIISAILICGVLLIIAGTWLGNSSLTSLGNAFLSILFWLFVIVVAIIIVSFLLFLKYG